MTRFGPDGQQVIGQPQRQSPVVMNTRFRTPRSVNWNIELDREWYKNLFVRMGYQQRQARREFVLNPVESPDQGSILGLDNSGKLPLPGISSHGAIQVPRARRVCCLLRTFVCGGYFNDFNSYFGNFENPIIRGNERSRYELGLAKPVFVPGRIPRAVSNYRLASSRCPNWFSVFNHR